MADSTQYARYTGLGGGGGGGVTSLNGETGAVVLVAGTGISVTPSGQNITIASTSAGDLTLTNVGSTPNAQGASLSGQALTLQPANTSFPGVLLAADWNTFNGKQAAGSYITSLTGDGIATGPGAAALTLATVNSNVGSFTNANITVNAKGLITAAANGTAGTVTAVSIASANGFAGSSSGGTTPALTISTSITGILQGNGTAISAAATTGSGSVVLATAPTMTNPVVGTQSQGDSSTKAASTSYVDVAIANAVAGVNPAIAVQAATTSASNTSGFTYNNGASGIGATFTGPTNTALVVDGFTFTALGQRLLVKNDTQSPSGAFNGVYYVTQLQAAILPLILTRALDYDQPSDINNTGAIPVINGTVNGTTSWVLTSQVVTVGTTPLTFTEFTRNPADYLLKANNLSDVASASTSFNNISPMTTGGDLIYGGSSGSATRLANGNAGQVLQSQGTTLAPIWATNTANVLSQGTETSFTSNGTFTTPSNSSTATIYEYTIVGGGGASGGSALSGSSSGGGAGAQAIGTFSGVAASTAITVTVGTGGTPGVGLGSAGGSGTSSTISGTGLTTVTCDGGVGGLGSAAGTGSSNSGGAGGTITAGSPNILSIIGQSGGNGWASASIFSPGDGGSTIFPGGGRGAGTGLGFGPGQAPAGFGNGGGGSANGGSGAGSSIAGSDGIVIFRQLTP